MESSYQFIKNWLPRLIVLSALILLALSLYFIYQNVWEVFASSKKSFLLQQEVVPTELKVEIFKKIEERINNKKVSSETNLEELKNPFLMIMGKVEEPKLK